MQRWLLWLFLLFRLLSATAAVVAEIKSGVPLLAALHSTAIHAQCVPALHASAHPKYLQLCFPNLQVTCAEPRQTKCMEANTKAYHPDSFAKIRNHFGIREQDYADALHPNNLVPYNSNSRSGQMFWKTRCGRFFVKTQSHADSKTMRSILPRYLNRVCGGPNSERLGALTYDVKGSITARKAGKGGASEIMKDQEFRAHKEQFLFSTEQQHLFMHALRQDVEFLSSAGLMDYSMLVAVGPADWRWSDFLGLFQAIVRKLAPISMRSQDDRVYTLMLIDFLQRYTLKKRLETLVKGILHGRNNISALPPREYGRRFLRMFQDRMVLPE